MMSHGNWGSVSVFPRGGRVLGGMGYCWRAMRVIWNVLWLAWDYGVLTVQGKWPISQQGLLGQADPHSTNYCANKSTVLGALTAGERATLKLRDWNYLLQYWPRGNFSDCFGFGALMGSIYIWLSSFPSWSLLFSIRLSGCKMLLGMENSTNKTTWLGTEIFWGPKPVCCSWWRKTNILSDLSHAGSVQTSGDTYWSLSPVTIQSSSSSSYLNHHSICSTVLHLSSSFYLWFSSTFFFQLSNDSHLHLSLFPNSKILASYRFQSEKSEEEDFRFLKRRSCAHYPHQSTHCSLPRSLPQTTPPLGKAPHLPLCLLLATAQALLLLLSLLTCCTFLWTEISSDLGRALSLSLLLFYCSTWPFPYSAVLYSISEAFSICSWICSSPVFPSPFYQTAPINILTIPGQSSPFSPYLTITAFDTPDTDFSFFHFVGE